MDKNQLNKLRDSLLSLKEGNIDSLETIYELTRKGVFSFVLPIMQTVEKAEDITQTTYIQIYEHIELFDKKKNPLNWILTIAKNLALTEVKKDSREIATDFADPINKDRVFTYDQGDYDTPTIDVANRVLKKEELQIVLLYAIGEYKHREIAKILNIPLGTVTWKYNVAIRKLRKALDEKE